MDLNLGQNNHPIILEHLLSVKRAGLSILNGGERKLSVLSNICLELLNRCAASNWPTIESGEPEQMWLSLMNENTTESNATLAAAAHAAHRSEQEYGSRMPSSGAVSAINAHVDLNEKKTEGDEKSINTDTRLDSNKFTATEAKEINKWSYHQGTLCIYPMLRLAFLRANEPPSLSKMTSKDNKVLSLIVESPLVPIEGLP